MSPEKDSILKIIAGSVLVLLLFLVVKRLLLPIIPELSLAELKALRLLDFVKISEFILTALILAGFVMQELLHALSGILQRDDHSKSTGSRWSDLGYVFVGVFGSAGLYICIFKIALEVPL
jgi:phosphatidylglycerophosphatase A